MRSRRACAGLVLATMLAGGAVVAQPAPTGIPERGVGATFFVPGTDGPEARMRFRAPIPDGAALFFDDGIELRFVDGETLRIEFVGARPSIALAAECRLDTVVHYLIGGDPSQFRTNVPAYSRLRYRDVWEGVDLVVHATRGALKYEFRVAPEAPSSAIRLRYVGAKIDRLLDGRLEVTLPSGRRLTDPAPVSHQGGVGVESAFVVDGKKPDELTFEVGHYDRSSELIIDPVFVTFGGYAMFGVPVVDVSVDSAGALIVVGTGVSQDMMGDCVVAKVKPDGSGFEFVTYLGSPGSPDAGISAHSHATGIIIGGQTMSSEATFPVSGGPDLTFNGGVDFFVCKLSLDGSRIIYCGYVGGSLGEILRDIAVDAAGAVWLGGQTTSADFPTLGGPQLTQPGPQPACVAKVSADGSSLVLSGYIGGSGGEYVIGLAIDANGDGYAVGITGSDERSFPVKIGPLTTRQGRIDAFVVKIDGLSGTLHYAGYVGSSLNDQANGVAVDGQGSAYVIGWTNDQATFPIVNPIPNLQSRDFLAKVKPDGSGFVYSTFLGRVDPMDLVVDANGRCYLCGTYRLSPSPPAFPVGGALSSAVTNPDVVLARVAPNGQSFDYAGFHGGSGYDIGTAIALGPRGEVFLGGQTWSRDFPVMVGPSSIYNGIATRGAPAGSFVMRVAQTVAATPLTARPGTSVAVDCVASEDVGLPYQVGTALSGGPIALPGQRRVDLSPDGVLQVSVGGTLPGVFRNYAGTVPANGQWTSTIALPPFPALVGVNLFTAFLTFAPGHPGGIKSISNATPTTIVP